MKLTPSLIDSMTRMGPWPSRSVPAAYCWYLSGHFAWRNPVNVSAFGDWAMWIVLAIWMKSLTGSSARAGLVFFVLGLGSLAGPLGGLLADRMRRRPLMIACDCVLGYVGFFEFAVQVPQPTKDAEAYTRWLALFNTAGRFNLKMKEGATCLTKIDGGMYNAGRQGNTLRSGPANVNTPPPGQIKDLDYLTTGLIAGGGSSLTITARVEAAYSRELVKSVSVSTPPGLEQLQVAADALAAQMKESRLYD